MALHDYNFLPEYRSGYNDLIGDFYYPALARAAEYWRAAGFFSSSVFEAVGAPLGNFIASGGHMRLVTSVRLSEDDIAAINEGLSKREVVERRLLAILRYDFSNPSGSGARILSTLLSIGRLEIKIATPSSGLGIYHEKIGLFLDNAGDYVAFSGSPNESRTGLETNYEAVDVFTSWNDTKRACSKRRYFEQLWSGEAVGAETFEFPEAVRRELIRINGSEATGRVEPAAPSDKWRHQAEAIRIFLQRQRGVLEMATGTGKTRTALEIANHLVHDRSIETIIVSADGNDLLDQWYKQLVHVATALPGRYSVVRHFGNHHDRDRYLLNPRRTILLASRPALAHVLRRLRIEVATHCLLIHDEVHRLGSAGNREALGGLTDHIPFRLGLSATPDREYDYDGNQFVQEHVGPVIFQFGLEDAIKRGILSRFNYHPLEYVPDADDRLKVQQVYRKQAARRHTGQPMSQEEVWTELARVHKTSAAKLPVFRDFIAGQPQLLRRCIIFVETREYGDLVLPIVHQHRYDFHTYYADDDSETLQAFARGDIECLLTCHRISEGIDIQSVENVILFSSARARLETIQRMGRCLRVDAANPEKRANIVDFVRIDPDEQERGAINSNADQERRDWLKSLSMVSLENA